MGFPTRLQTLLFAAVATLGVAGAPGVALAQNSAKADKLEARTQKEIEEATENLGKVQTGAMPFKKAMKRIDLFIKHAEELERVARSRAQKYLQELNATRHWTRKFAPLVVPSVTPKTEPEKATPKPDPGSDDSKSDESDSDTPDPDPEPDPTPEVRPDPGSEDPGYTPPTLPTDPVERAKRIAALMDDADASAKKWACSQLPFSPSKAAVVAAFTLLFTDGDAGVRDAAYEGLRLTRHDALYDQFKTHVMRLPEPKLDRLCDLIKEKPEPRCVEALFNLAMRFKRPIGGANSQSKAAMAAYIRKARAAWQDGWRHRVIQIWRSWPEPLVSSGFSLTWKAKKKLRRKGLRYMQEILLAIGVIGNTRGIRYAVPFLASGKEPTRPLRAPALAAIEMVGTPSVPWLAMGLRGGKTKLWCKQALWNVTGQRLTHNPKVWMRWWNNNRPG